MAVRTPGFMERMARMGLGIVQPAMGLSVLAQLVAGAWSALDQPLRQHALFVGKVPHDTVQNAISHVAGVQGPPAGYPLAAWRFPMPLRQVSRGKYNVNLRQALPHRSAL